MFKRFLSVVITAAVLLTSISLGTDVKISQLPTAGGATSSDEFPVNQAGVTKKVTLSQIDTALGVSSHVGNASIHRAINDSIISATGLWSSSKINTELTGKAGISHSHSGSDITTGTVGVTVGGTGLSTVPSGKLLYSPSLNALAPLDLDSTLGITAGTLSVQNNTNTQKVTVSKSGTTTGTRKQINLIEGSGVTITATDNAGSDRVDVTIASTATAYPKGYISGPAPVYASASMVTIRSGLKVRSSDDSTELEFTSDATCDLSVSGANGLDSGTEAANTWYYVYAIRNTGTSTNACLLSTTNEANTGSITLPSGYTKKRQLKLAVRNDGSSNILPFVNRGDATRGEVFYRVKIATANQIVGPTNVLDGGTATAYTDLSLAYYVPPIATQAVLRVGIYRVSNDGLSGFIRKDGSSVDEWEVRNEASKQIQDYDGIFTETSTAQVIEYKIASGAALDIAVVGYVITEVR